MLQPHRQPRPRFEYEDIHAATVHLPVVPSLGPSGMWRMIAVAPIGILLSIGLLAISDIAAVLLCMGSTLALLTGAVLLAWATLSRSEDDVDWIEITLREGEVIVEGRPSELHVSSTAVWLNPDAIRPTYELACELQEVELMQLRRMLRTPGSSKPVPQALEALTRRVTSDKRSGPTHE